MEPGKASSASVCPWESSFHHSRGWVRGRGDRDRQTERRVGRRERNRDGPWWFKL